jgi:hypothetical protein
MYTATVEREVYADLLAKGYDIVSAEDIVRAARSPSSSTRAAGS